MCRLENFLIKLQLLPLWKGVIGKLRYNIV